MRKNGFWRDGKVSLNVHQAGAGSAYLGLVVAFFALQTPAVADGTARAALEATFAAMTAAVLALFAKAAGTAGRSDSLEAAQLQALAAAAAAGAARCLTLHRG